MQIELRSRSIKTLGLARGRVDVVSLHNALGAQQKKTMSSSITNKVEPALVLQAQQLGQALNLCPIDIDELSPEHFDYMVKAFENLYDPLGLMQAIDLLWFVIRADQRQVNELLVDKIVVCLLLSQAHITQNNINDWSK